MQRLDHAVGPVEGGFRHVMITAPSARRPLSRPARLLTAAAVLALTVTLAGCVGTGTGVRTSDDDILPPAVASPGVGTTQARPPQPPTDTATPTATPTAMSTARSTARVLPERLPGLGPRTLAKIPADARQVVLVTGEGRNSSTLRTVLYRRTGDGWEAGPIWPAHNAREGWTDDHHAGDLRSPIGVFTLTDAGGLLPDPGTELPYDRSGGFTIGGTGFAEEPLAGSFDHVVAIDYNRKPGTSPLDRTRPLGAGRGGGIRLHIDHGGPTHGCVSLQRNHIRHLLRALDPDRHPVIVMGDAESLAR
ncbi:hypothetical protein [Streptomyces luteolifulvus]|nr:hypothetical protein [Streptomyces luteolifulvus]